MPLSPRMVLSLGCLSRMPEKIREQSTSSAREGASTRLTAAAAGWSLSEKVVEMLKAWKERGSWLSSPACHSGSHSSLQKGWVIVAGANSAPRDPYLSEA